MLHPHHLTECYETFRNILGDHKEHFVYFEIFISVTLGQVTFWGPACNFGHNSRSMGHRNVILSPSRLFYQDASIKMQLDLVWSMFDLTWPRSEVTNGFSSITFNWIEIETPFDVYRVCLVNADRMICNMTYFGQVMTLTWGQLLNLTFWGHIIYHSMRLDELRTMVCELFLYLFGKKSYCRKIISGKFAILIWHYMTSIG